MERGFISIPIIIAIVVGIFAVGGATYIGVTTYTESNDTNESELIKRIEELESKLDEKADVTTATTTEEIIEAKEDKEAVIEASTQAPVFSPAPTPIPTPTPSVPVTPTMEAPEDFRATCEVSRTNVNQNASVDIEARIFFERPSDYEISWSKDPTSKSSETKVRFRFDAPGEEAIIITFTRKSDGYSKDIACQIIIVECISELCFSDEQKQRNILRDIIDEINTWYDGTYASSPVNICLISESIIRLYEYEYTVSLGGENIPVFSVGVDCLTSVAPRAYQAKIKLLKDTL